jgi:hypothetical protein
MPQIDSNLVLDEITVLLPCGICGESFLFVDKLLAHQADHTTTPYAEVQNETECTLMAYSSATGGANSSDRNKEHAYQQSQELRKWPSEISLTRFSQRSLGYIEERSRCNSLQALSCLTERPGNHLPGSFPTILDSVHCSRRLLQLVATATGVLLDAYPANYTTNPRSVDTRHIQQGNLLPPILPDGESQGRSLPHLNDVLVLCCGLHGFSTL